MEKSQYLSDINPNDSVKFLMNTKVESPDLEGSEGKTIFQSSIRKEYALRSDFIEKSTS